MAKNQLYINFYGIWPEMQGYLQNRLEIGRMAIRPYIHADKLTDQNLDPQTTILATFVESPIDRQTMDHLPHLRMIAAMSTGYDHIDLAAAQEKGIVVCNVPSYGEVTVAEHTFALILTLTRKLFASIKRVKEGVYDFHGLRGVDLQNKTIGIVGTGKIGIQVIKRAKAFDMHVLAYDPFPNKQAAREYDFIYTTLDKLLAASDIISLHVPLLPSTHHLLNKKNIGLIKKGAYIINTARGGLIDPEALVIALNNDRLNGVGLDVLEDEELIQDEEHLIAGGYTASTLKTTAFNNLLIDHPKVVITPHNAFNSTEALQRIIDTTIENIKAFSKGVPQNEVKPKN